MATVGYERADLVRKGPHRVVTFAFPQTGMTTYGARCLECGDSWSTRDLAKAKERLIRYKLEACEPFEE